MKRKPKSAPLRSSPTRSVAGKVPSRRRSSRGSRASALTKLRSAVEAGLAEKRKEVVVMTEKGNALARAWAEGVVCALENLLPMFPEPKAKGRKSANVSLSDQGSAL